WFLMSFTMKLLLKTVLLLDSIMTLLKIFTFEIKCFLFIQTLPDRCAGIEFDAIAPDEKGTSYFFKGDHLWVGFSGPAELSNGTFKDLDEYHHLGHVDAAFRMHNKKDSGDHDHIYLFLNDKVFSYYKHSLEKGFPLEIQQQFPGVPSHLDAAVECPAGECVTDAVLFFKGKDVYHFDIATKMVKKKAWDHLPNCTSAFRWLEHYYCFHGHHFTRFHPVTGEVGENYPKDARHYFMRCSDHGASGKKEPCSAVHLDAITADDTGKRYAFRGKSYIRLDSHRDGTHPFPITKSWRDVTDGVDAVFSYDSKIYLIKGNQVYIYKADAHYTLIDGYPKPLKDELGVQGPVDAAFMCEGEPTVFLIQGQKMFSVDLNATPRSVKREVSLPFTKVDAAECGADGVRVFVGSKYYKYESPTILSHMLQTEHFLNTYFYSLGQK
uniref:Hemopexin n=1 Tax=Denticeps clupeoides TaxID=299321 RepID=A0AAY4F038_9TELE